jgi:hypothetical protein
MRSAADEIAVNGVLNSCEIIAIRLLVLSSKEEVFPVLVFSFTVLRFGISSG